MITVIKYHGGGRVDIMGKSTDEKPKEVAGIPVANASFFIEMDTDKIFKYDEETKEWIE